MALATVLPAGIIIDRAKTTRLFNLWVGFTLQLWQEETITETTEYVALTRTLATSTVDANAQPTADPADGTYTWTMNESQRYVGADGSYTVKRMFEQKVYTQV